jgi:hypothetical protein
MRREAVADVGRRGGGGAGAAQEGRGERVEEGPVAGPITNDRGWRERNRAIIGDTYTGPGGDARARLGGPVLGAPRLNAPCSSVPTRVSEFFESSGFHRRRIATACESFPAARTDCGTRGFRSA